MANFGLLSVPPALTPEGQRTTPGLHKNASVPSIMSKHELTGSLSFGHAFHPSFPSSLLGDSSGDRGGGPANGRCARERARIVRWFGGCQRASRRARTVGKTGLFCVQEREIIGKGQNRQSDRCAGETPCASIV